MNQTIIYENNEEDINISFAFDPKKLYVFKMGASVNIDFNWCDAKCGFDCFFEYLIKYSDNLLHGNEEDLKYYMERYYNEYIK